MKITSDSTIKSQIAFQLKSIKTMESNASRLGMTELVQSFRQQRNILTKAFNSLIGHDNSVSGIQYGERRARTAYLNEQKNRMADRTNVSYVYSANGTLV
jgi:predicted subunit of tRNA(5-methylaminomethyl-2-thiouridylate) methyltransferase